MANTNSQCFSGNLGFKRKAGITTVIVIGETEDRSHPGEKWIRVFFTVQLDVGHYVDIMVSEEDHLIYSMQAEDGNTVYDDKGNGCDGFVYDETEAFRSAVSTFIASYGRKPDISWKDS